MYGYLVGSLAVTWGVLVAYVDQAGATAPRHLDRLCTAVLIAGVAVIVGGGAGALFGAW